MKNLWFKYFSMLLTYPSEEWFSELENIEKLLERKNKGFYKFSEYFKNFGLEKLKEEYTKLFISSFPTLPCPPYESYYREGLLLGETSQEVLEYYQRAGYQFTREGESPDHIAVELEFLALTEDFYFLIRFKEWFGNFKECVKKHSPIYEKIVDFIDENLKGRVKDE
ncbi:MAG: molecular chaperone TorD family protein [Caldimicrobium sp.]